MKERMWGGIIPILAIECTEDTEKCKNALRTQHPLRFQISHELYISTAMAATGSNNYSPKPPPTSQSFVKCEAFRRTGEPQSLC